MSFTFVAFPKDGSKVYLYEEDRTTKFRQVLWGDFLAVQGEEEDGFRRVTWGRDLEESRTVYIPKEHTCDARPLEIIFVDVGQGDGAVLITPERIENERIIVIDAGIGRNMLEFLEGRFKAYSKVFEFHAAVITHPDEDHYKGVQPIFEQHQIGFDTIYQNGLVERPIGSHFDKVGASANFVDGLTRWDRHQGSAFNSRRAATVSG